MRHGTLTALIGVAVLVLGGSPQQRLADLDRIMRDVAPALSAGRGS